MCTFKSCPIYDKCEQDIEQVLYCRHIEMIKRIALVRAKLHGKKKLKLASKKLSHQGTVQVSEGTVSEPSQVSN